MSFPLRFYCTARRKITTGLLCLLSIICFGHAFSLQLKTGFSLSYFAFAFILMNIAFFLCYRFLRCMLSPILQIFSDQVIVVLQKREVIKLESIKSLQVRRFEVELCYQAEDQELVNIIKVSRNPYVRFSILDGKIQD
jgi:hypothetical protein